MRIAVLQMAAIPGDVSANLKRVADAAAEAAEAGAALLVAPELATTGYGAGAAMNRLAEPPDGAQADALRDMAGAHDLAIVTGFAERDGDRVFNSALFLDPTGVRACYRKCQLWGDYERGLFQAAAPSTVHVDHGGLRIGMLICYDVEFPERTRALALEGVDLIAVPTATPMGQSASFIARHMLPVRSFENQVFIAYANHHGSDGRFSYAGLSRVVAPDGGEVAGAAATGDRVLVADIAPEAYAQSRRQNPYLRDLVRDP